MKKPTVGQLARLVRYLILKSTTRAGSGHPSSCLSAADIMTTLFFGGFFRADLKKQAHPNNDRLIFSKGHAAPLLYALYCAAGELTEGEIMDLRQIDSPLEGHPSMRFGFTELATGSLGQGLSAGVGMALNAKYLDKLPYKTFVLLGDSEVAEGQIWEAASIASHYKLDNLIAILDVNRLGQRGETMHGHDLDSYVKKAISFGFAVEVIDGHDLDDCARALVAAVSSKDKPFMIIAKTIKGKGVSILEDENGWHGRALTEQELSGVLDELGEVDLNIIGSVLKPENIKPAKSKVKKIKLPKLEKQVRQATRKVYGSTLSAIFKDNPNIVVLDAETGNSTYAEDFKKNYPDNFFEMFIAEQNMIGTALGLSARGKKPFVSSFAAFLTRGFDQIRMASYSEPNIVFCGSHAGVSIGSDGPSQMGLEDIAMFRTISESVVLYPSDAISASRLIEVAAKTTGLTYIRTTRMDTPAIYKLKDNFTIGGSSVIKFSKNDQVTIVAAGITLHEALKAYEELQKEGVSLRIIDLYSVKPLDINTLSKAADDTKALLVVEDHYEAGGIGEAVKGALLGKVVHHLFVDKIPRSGRPEEVLSYVNIDAYAIIRKVRQILNQ